VRSAILFGGVLPEMRKDVEALANDLSALAAVRKQITTERAGLEKARASMADDIAQLTGLTEHRQKQQADVEKVLTAERQKAALLGRRSEDLQELIAKLEQELDRTTRAARLAARNGEEKKATDARAGLAALKDPGRLAPAIAFARAKGTLPLPVNGVRIREYGATDGVGGQEKGMSISARPGAQITAPCDGWVVYAGPFRNYGQLLILNAGDGYHVLLAGMDRISVDLGQFVVTGEPVAVMGGRTQSPAAIATGSGQPILYVEFRKDGTPVDSSPWWAASDSEKVRG
jgi:septal ring factor EnvC (AmiA/AmiB activator)